MKKRSIADFFSYLLREYGSTTSGDCVRYREHFNDLSIFKPVTPQMGSELFAIQPFNISGNVKY